MGNTDSQEGTCDVSDERKMITTTGRSETDADAVVRDVMEGSIEAMLCNHWTYFRRLRIARRSEEKLRSPIPDGSGTLAMERLSIVTLSGDTNPRNR